MTPGNPGVQRIRAAFARARQEGRAAFIPYMTGGYPDPERFLAVCADLLRRADILEIGLPYSDPLGDGPTIQRAGERALSAGTSTRGTLDLVARLRQRTDVPIVVMTYVNPIYAVGPEAFMQLCVESGVDGLVLPDLPPDEDQEIAALAAEHGLSVTFLIAPTSTPERVALVARACTGFLYAASVTGVTGARDGAALGEVPELVALARRHTACPVVVGFGVRDSATARQVARVADGVVAGSVFIDALERGEDLAAAVEAVAGGCLVG